MVFSNSSKLQSLLFGLPDDLSIINDDLATLLSSSALDSILLLEANDDDVAAAISSMRSVAILLISVVLLFGYDIDMLSYLFV